VTYKAFDFEDVASLATGLPAEDDGGAYQIARALLIEQTAAMEERLIRCGVDMTTKQKRGVVSIGNVSLTQQEAEKAFRKCRFLPVVAKADRAGWLREFEYFLKNDPQGRFARYGVISCGQRVEFDQDFVENSKDQIAYTQANIRRWINESREIYGVDVLLKTFETALNPKSGHNHFNVVYIPRKGMRKDQFRAWLAYSKKRLGVHWSDCGRIKSVREVIKYACKIQGTKSLETISDSAFLSLFELMLGRSTIEAHGSFADFRRKLEKGKKRVVWMRQKGAPPRLVIMKKQPRKKSRTPRGDALQENLILGRQLPRSMGAGVLEPVTIVQNLTFNPVTEAGRKRLEELEGHVVEAREWARENGSSFSVHTTPASVQDTCPAEAKPRQCIPLRHDPMQGRRRAEPPRPSVMERGPDGKWREARKRAEPKPLIPPRHDPMKGRLKAEPPPYQPRTKEKRKPFRHVSAYYIEGGQWRRMVRFAEGWRIDRGAALEPVWRDARRTMPAGATAAFMRYDGSWEWTTQGPIHRPAVQAGR
jgi:hypothetical protein